MSRKVVDIDLSGMTFGKLTPLYRVRNGVWQFRCSCGNELVMHQSKVITKNPGKSAKSCGCRYHDISGKKFNRLTAVKWLSKHPTYRSIWEFLCDCGTLVTLPANRVKSENDISCGCSRRSVPRELALIRVVSQGYKQSAKRRKLCWALTEEETVKLMTGDCTYCGAPPSNPGPKHIDYEDYRYSGIDRRDSSKGYTIENCTSCCAPCNRSKSDMTYDQWMEHLKRLVTHQISNGWGSLP